MHAQVGPPRDILPAQGTVVLFPEKRMMHDSLADLMMRRLVSEATPELEYLRADAACGGPSVSRK